MLAVACLPAAALAQVPYIEGTWTLDVAASRLPPGPPPQKEVRSYRVGADGVFVGQAVRIEPNGAPYFLMFAGKLGSHDYPEFDARAAARYLADGSAPPTTYAESPTPDDHRVKWMDKAAGRIVGSGEKWVSPDGKTMSLTVDGTQYLYVFDRTGPPAAQ